MTTATYQLLVIDDSARDALLLERMLKQSEEANFIVTHVTAATAGLDAIERTTYDLVLLDYYLPDMDGLAFLEEKQSRELAAPVIMLTAFGQDRLPIEAIQAGAVDYFRKDELHSSLLGKAIHQAIQQAQLHAEAAATAARVKELEATIAQLQQQLDTQRQ